MGVPADHESIERYARAGADRIVLGLEGEEDGQDLAAMEKIAGDVM